MTSTWPWPDAKCNGERSFCVEVDEGKRNSLKKCKYVSSV